MSSLGKTNPGEARALVAYLVDALDPTPSSPPSAALAPTATASAATGGAAAVAVVPVASVASAAWPTPRGELARRGASVGVISLMGLEQARLTPPDTT